MGERQGVATTEDGGSDIRVVRPTTGAARFSTYRRRYVGVFFVIRSQKNRCAGDRRGAGVCDERRKRTRIDRAYCTSNRSYVFRRFSYYYRLERYCTRERARRRVSRHVIIIHISQAERCCFPITLLAPYAADDQRLAVTCLRSAAAEHIRTRNDRVRVLRAYGRSTVYK